jgi:hypothetical protein
MKISATWSSSSIATRVSWALEEMIISLLMPVAPVGRSERRLHIDRLLAALYRGDEAREQRDDVAQPGHGNGQ